MDYQPTYKPTSRSFDTHWPESALDRDHSGLEARWAELRRLRRHSAQCNRHYWEPWDATDADREILAKPVRPPGRIKAKDPTTIVQLGPLRAYHGTCEDPVDIQLEANFATHCGTTRERIFTMMTVRCRKCGACTRAFASHWHHRAMEEIRTARRCRMTLLTFASPVNEAQLYREMRNYLARIREKYPNQKFTELWVPERGTSGSHRLHVHLLTFEYGEPIHRRAYRQRSKENPKGLWLAGFAGRSELIRNTPERAIGYVLKYLLKAEGQVRLPGGRRLSASPFFGRYAEKHAAAVPRTASADAMLSWANQLLLIHANRPTREPAASERPNPTATVGITRNATSCAFSNESPASRDAQPRPREPPGSALQWEALSIGAPNATMRLIPRSEIPPEIVKAWDL
jgi:hypothetical protein